MIYKLFIEYSIPLYRICKAAKVVDNSEKTDVPRLKLWITVWTVWKCMRLYTSIRGNEYSRMDPERREKCRSDGRLRESRKTGVYACLFSFMPRKVPWRGTFSVCPHASPGRMARMHGANARRRYAFPVFRASFPIFAIVCPLDTAQTKDIQ